MAGDVGEGGGEDGELGVGVFVFLWGFGGVVVGVVRSGEGLEALSLLAVMLVLRSRRCDAGVGCDGPGWGGEIETAAGGGKSPTGEGEEWLRHCRCSSVECRVSRVW